MTQVQGPNGVNFPQYIQSAETINNNFIYNIPSNYYQDRLDLSTQSAPITFQGAVQNGVQSFGCQAQAFIGGSSYSGLSPNQELELLFYQSRCIIDALYSQPPVYNINVASDPLADLRGMQALVNQSINDAFAPLPGEEAVAESVPAEEGGIDAAKAAKIEKAADALHDAMAGWGTDEDTVYQILEGLSPEEKAYLEIAYANKHGDGNPEALRDDIRGDFSGKGERRALNALNEGVHETPIAAAIALHDAMDGAGTDEETVKTIFENATPEQLAEIETMYDQMYGNGKDPQLRKDIKGDFSRFWDGMGAGAASGYATGSILGMIPGLNFITGGIGALVGGTVGLIADPSGEERNTYIAKLNQGILYTPETTESAE